MRYDVVVVGGSYAGLSAALMLGRARRSVLVVDSGLPRNRFSSAAHGILGHDGRTPAEIRQLGRDQLLHYPTVALAEDVVSSIDGAIDDFQVALASGGAATARRIVLAHGVTDTLPAIDGLAACWGRSVLHCPYCHGYEFAGRRLGALVNDVMPTHQASMLPDWSDDVTLFADGTSLSPEDREALSARGVEVVDDKVASVEHRDGCLVAVQLADGGSVPLDALFVAPRTTPSSPLAAQLGCAMADGPFGPYVEVDPQYATTVPGVCAAGDLAAPMANVPLAVAGGAVAGAMTHRSLMFG